MRWLRRCASLVFAVLLATSSACAAAPPPSSRVAPCAVTKTANVAVPMRDGTVLRADVYRPAIAEAVPVILMRTQYSKDAAQVEAGRYQRPEWFASYCYLVVIQDIRGQGASTGTSPSSPMIATTAMTASNGPRGCPDHLERSVCTDRPTSARPNG